MFEIIPLPQFSVLPVQQSPVHEVIPQGLESICQASDAPQPQTPSKFQIQIQMVVELGQTDVGHPPPTQPKFQMLASGQNSDYQFAQQSLLANGFLELGQWPEAPQPPNHPK